MKSYFTKQAKSGDIIKKPGGKLEYLVISAGMGGGGFGHGRCDEYPDGWRVTIRKLDSEGSYDPKGKKSNFFQSGCFSGLIPEVEVVGKMEKIETVQYVRLE